MSWHPGSARVLPDSPWSEGVDVWCDGCETAQIWITRRSSADRQVAVHRALLAAGWSLDPELRDLCPTCSQPTISGPTTGPVAVD